MTPYLVAHVINATCEERAKIVFDVAYQDEDGDWATISGWPVYPFWTHELDLSQGPTAMPEGWLEHLADEAAKYASRRPSPATARQELLALVAPQKTFGKIHRRF